MKFSPQMTRLTAAFLTAVGLITTGCGAGQLPAVKDLGTAQNEAQAWSVKGTSYGVDSVYKTACIDPSNITDEGLGKPESIGQLDGKNIYYLYAKGGQRLYFTECAPTKGR